MRPELYNLVKTAIHCPTCGQKIDTIYTAEGAEGSVETLRHETVMIEAVRSFYGQCDGCGTWIDGTCRPDTPGTRPSDFTLLWDPDRERTLSRRRFFTRLIPR